MKLKTILLSTLTLATLNSCCWTDHSETIIKVAKPMLKELDAFYQKNHRHPNKAERDVMLMKSGCSKVKNEECSFGWKSIKIKSKKDEDKTYSIILNYDNTYCLFGIFDGGNIMNLDCVNPSCLNIN